MLKHFIITLILSCLVSFNSYALDKILLYGDSLMSGYKLDKKNSLNNILEQKLLLLGYNYKIINASIPGETSFGGLNRLNWTLAEKNITHVVLCLGANDMLRGIKPNETYKNLEKIIKIINAKNVKIILAKIILTFLALIILIIFSRFLYVSLGLMPLSISFAPKHNTTCVIFFSASVQLSLFKPPKLVSPGMLALIIL